MVLQTYQGIVQQIIDTLKADADLATPSKVRQYFFGEPKDPQQIKQFPVIYVQFSRREGTGIADTAKYEYILTFDIGIIGRAIKEDTAEKEVYDFINEVDSILDLDANLTLSGKVAKRRLAREVEIARPAIPGMEDWAITWANITHRVVIYE